MEPQQHQFLLAVKGLPKSATATIGELAERLQLKHHSTVELVNRLEKLGYVARKAGKQDRRQVIVQLDKFGASILRKLSLAHHQELESGRTPARPSAAFHRSPAWPAKKRSMTPVHSNEHGLGDFSTDWRVIPISAPRDRDRIDRHRNGLGIVAVDRHLHQPGLLPSLGHGAGFAGRTIRSAGGRCWCPLADLSSLA